jgi:C-terminal peptidase prc
VAEYIRTSYVEEPNPSKTMKGAFRGLVGPLDPLSSYLDPPTVEKYLKLRTQTFKETGITVYKKFGTYPIVISVKENSPAEKAGIKPGDHLSELDGQPLLMLSMLETNLYLKDTDENPAKITVLRSKDSEEMSVKRKLLHDSHFVYSQIKKTIGILKIHNFFPPCSKKIRDQWLSRLPSQNEALIVDVRNCSEGEIGEALQFVNIFLQADTVGYFLNKKGVKSTLSCPDEAVLSEMPLIVWTNQATIGPAEAVAGVLKEFKRAHIVGKKTQGLLAKQTFFPLEDGSGLLLTSEIFYLPKGKKVWQKGIEPDTEIQDINPESEIYLTTTLELLSKE